MKKKPQKKSKKRPVEPMDRKEFFAALRLLGACEEARVWCRKQRGLTPEQLYRTCECRAWVRWLIDWLDWTIKDYDAIDSARRKAFGEFGRSPFNIIDYAVDLEILRGRFPWRRVQSRLRALVERERKLAL